MFKQRFDEVKANVPPWRPAAMNGTAEGDRFFRSIRAFCVPIKSILSAR
jgi:hypothetical protein